jgi:hypothetical protein
MNVPVLHETDLFRPHEDPDDHWDLACQFALARRGFIDLRGVLIDFPPNPGYGDPDIAAVHQMNYITGLSVPVGVGQESAQEQREGSGVHLLKRILEEAQTPVVLHIVGSSRDIALCGRRYPELFREKVRAIYLNAGSGVNGQYLEYNVELDIPSYSAIFDLPCPVYWMPCFHEVAPEMKVGEYGTFFRFLQGDLWKNYKPEVQNYFVGVLSKRQDGRWLQALQAPVDQRLLEHFGKTCRNMWCTGGFLHAAGLSINMEGKIVPLGAKPEDEVFSFVPVQVTCDEQGRNHWSNCKESVNRFLYRVNDQAVYPSAMTRALSEMVSWL